jgi:hypothetical protein
MRSWGRRSRLGEKLARKQDDFPLLRQNHDEESDEHYCIQHQHDGPILTAADDDPAVIAEMVREAMEE